MARGGELTVQQRKFVENFCAGMSQAQAARVAGYAHPQVEAYQLMKLEHVRKAVRAEQDRTAREALITRRRVLEGLLEAVEIARVQSEPATMVASWREVAKICGYYAPEQKKIDLTIGVAHVSQIENMSDEELAQLIVEGESTRLDDAADSEAELPALPAPSEDPGADDRAEPEA